MSNRFSVGDFVYFEGTLVVVSAVRGVLGFNLYTILDTNDGTSQEVAGTDLKAAARDQ